MYFFQGFFFAAGVFCFVMAVVFLFILLIWIRKVFKRSYAEVLVWKDYLKRVQAEEQFEEAAFVLALIRDRAAHEMVALPSGYSLKKKLIFVESDEVEDRIETKVQKTIVKVS